MAISFQLKTDGSEEFSFNALDKNGELLMIGAEFPSKELAEQAIQDVRVGSMMSQSIAVGEAEGKKFFVIKNQAGQILVKSILFESELAFNNALHNVRDSACIAEVQDLT